MLNVQKENLTNHYSPNQILRSFPALQASSIKAYAINFVRKIPDDLYAEILDHAK